MKTLKFILITCISISFFVSCSSDDSNNIAIQLDPSEYYEELNVSYGNDAKQVFDMYLPANRTTDTKVLVLVHGGGWVQGDKADMNTFKDIVRQDLPDVAIININYRLANATTLPVPTQTDDITAIINMLKANQSNYVISDDFGFLGVSAGGHLSLLWSYAFDTSNDVKMVCSIVGPTNLADPEYTDNPLYNPLFAVFGDQLTDEFLNDVSPYHRASSTAPPTILFYGGQDPLVPTSQGVDMNDKLEALGVTHEFTLYPDEGHGWIGLNLLDTAVKLKAFTETHLLN